MEEKEGNILKTFNKNEKVIRLTSSTNSGSHKSVRIIITTTGFLFILISLYLINYNYVTGYEISIYTSVPEIWILLIGSILCGLVVIVSSISDNINFWVFGFFILMFSNFIATSLGALRGYYLYNPSDTSAHVGFAKDIISKGHFYEADMFPITHILIAQLSQISNISLSGVAMYFPGTYTVFYMVSTLLLAREILPNREYVLITSATSVVLLYRSIHVSLYPQALATFFLPLFFYLLFKSSETWKYELLFIIILIMFPWLHFVPTAAVIILLAFIYIFNKVCVYCFKRDSPFSSILGNSPYALLALIVISTIWYSSYHLFGVGVRELIYKIHGEASKTHQIEEMRILLSSTDVATMIEVFVKAYLHVLVYLFFSIIASIIVLLRSNNSKLKLLSVVFTLSGSLHFIILQVVPWVSIGRFLNLNLALWVTPLLVGFVLRKLFYKKFSLSRLLVLSILIVLSVSGLLNIYHSPYILQPNLQVTQANLDGHKWFFDHKHRHFLFSAMGSSPGLPAYLLGQIEYYKRNDIRNSYFELRYKLNEVLPPHFGYMRHHTIGEFFNGSRYLIVSKSFQLAINEPTLNKKGLPSPPWFWHGFNNTDFYKLEFDQSVDKLYTNNEFTVYLISSIKSYKISNV